MTRSTHRFGMASAASLALVLGLIAPAAAASELPEPTEIEAPDGAAEPAPPAPAVAVPVVPEVDATEPVPAAPAVTKSATVIPAVGSIIIGVTRYGPLEDEVTRVGDVAFATLTEDWVGSKFSYQWQRSGVKNGACTPSFSKISGATKAQYTLTKSDLQRCLRVKITAKGSKNQSKSATSQVISGPTEAGIINTAGVVQINADGASLTAVVAGWTHPDLKLKYQWYRNGKAVKNATKSTFKLSTSDRTKQIKVRVTVGLSGMVLQDGGTRVATSPAAVYAVSADVPPTINNPSPKVGDTLQVQQGAYSASGKVVDARNAYQWYRDGKKIKGATAISYKVTKSDKGKRLSVKVTAKAGAHVPYTGTTKKTNKVAIGVIQGQRLQPTFTWPATSPVVLTAALPTDSITEPGVKVAWQWLRNGKAIKNATKATYKPVAADYRTVLQVRATVTKAGYSTVKLTSSAALAEPLWITHTWSTDSTIHGTLAVGQVLTVDELTYHDGAQSSLSGVVEQYQWYRDGAKITGATAHTYTVVTADVGKKLSAKITYRKDGYIGSTATTLSTPRVGQQAFPGAPSLEAQATEYLTGVRSRSGGNYAGVAVLVAPGPGVGEMYDSIADTTAKRSYQWFRDSRAISGATKSTYTMTDKDFRSTMHVRITISRSGYSDVVRYSVPLDYSIAPPIWSFGFDEAEQALVLRQDSPLLVQQRVAPYDYTDVCTAADALRYDWWFSQTGGPLVPPECDGKTWAFEVVVGWYRQKGKTVNYIPAAGDTFHYAPTAADKGWQIYAVVEVFHKSYSYHTRSYQTEKYRVQ